MILHRCDNLPLDNISQYVNFFVKIACCSNELIARHSAAAVAIACVTYSARLFGDHQAELALIPASIRAAGGGEAAVEDLRNACRMLGLDFGDAAETRPPASPAEDRPGQQEEGSAGRDRTEQG